MRKFTYAIIIILLCIAQRSSAQIRATNPFFSDTNSSELFLHRPNRIRITELMPEDSVSLGRILPERVDSNIYTFRVDRRIQDTLFVRRKNKVVFTQSYSFRPNPDPVLHLGVVNGADPAHVTKDEILTYPTLVVESGNPMQLFVVRSFEMSVQTKDFFHGPILEASDRLSPEQIELIRQLRPGDRIYFENIRVLCPDHELRHFNNLYFSIIQ
jgi:hypothetical protein